jgi:hypothetical protein
MNLEQDPVIARALADAPVPDHAPGFWEELDRRIDLADRAEAGGLRPQERLVTRTAVEELDLRDDAGDAPAVAPAGVRTTTGELPAVAELRPPEATSRGQRLWFVAAAAVLSLVAVGLAGYVGGDDEPDSTTAASDDTTDPDDSPTTAGSSVEPTTAVAPPPTVPAVPQPLAAGAVSDWLDAVASGDVAAAAALTGPRSARYIESQGPDVTLEGFLIESSEGYGSMADAPDLEVAERPLGTFEFGEVVLVTVSGTYTGEGSDGFVTFVFPVVIDGDEALVEPWAFSPEAGGRLEVTLPVRTVDDVVLPADEAIELFAPVPGTVFFHLDDGAEGIRPVDTSTVAGSPFARYDPPGELAPGDHVVVLGFASPDGEVLVGDSVAFRVP